MLHNINKICRQRLKALTDDGDKTDCQKTEGLEIVFEENNFVGEEENSEWLNI